MKSNISVDVRERQLSEMGQLEKFGYTITYIAPQKEKNWDNWYVISGLANGNVIYLKRWVVADDIISVEFSFQKDQSAMYDVLIPHIIDNIQFISGK